MATQTSIEWVRGADGSDGMSWNAFRAEREIVRHGKTITVSAHHCEHVNEACRFCYAGALNPRLGGLQFKPGHRKDYRFVIDRGKLLAPLKRKKPTRIFVESMSDAFGEWWPTEFIDQLYAVMALTPHHTYINLSKRPERRRQYLDDPLRHNAIELAAEKIVRGPEWFGGKHMLPRLPLPNVIEGTSVSCQSEADELISILLQTRAAVRCVSCEPLLGPIDLTAIEAPDKVEGERWTFDALETGDYYTQWSETMLGEPRRSGGDGPYREHKIDWIIVGGESGRNARPFHLTWAESLIDQCETADVACFVKQLGSCAMSGGYPMHYAHSKGGDWSEWPDNLRVRQFPAIAREAHAA